MAENKSDRPLPALPHLSKEERRETEFEQTCVMPVQDTAALGESELAELLTLDCSSGFSKQEIDFALATSLIRGRHLNERRLRNALKNWTSFGSLSLCEFLQQRGELPKERLSAIQFDVFKQLNALESNRSWGTCCHSIAKRTSWLLGHLDPDGRVAKVLGLSQIPKMAEESEKRCFQAEYHLLRKLGQGGLGAVWLAVEGGLNRYVAIKEISDAVSNNPATLARFRREAEITGQLDHPGIVPIHLLGRNETDGRDFYVMRFLGNRTLDDAIREYHDRRELGQASPIAFHRLLTAFVSVCHAIAYAHSRRIIHRDLKPQNIALDDFGQVIVLDWGLAKVMGLDDPGSHFHDGIHNDTDHLDVTLAGQIMGTPLYMAPEQAAGRVDEIDERTDVYGLGAILFAILTGYAPHELSSDTLTGGQMASLLDLIIDRPLPRPRQLNSRIPRPLEAICLKAMATERHLRYGTATSLADDVQRWIANEPITALRESLYLRSRRWIAKHPWLFRTATAFCLLMIAGAITLGSTTYQRVAAANHLKVQTTLDETRELKTHLASQVATLTGSVRFLSALPPIQAIIDARLKRKGEPEDVWTDRLSRICSGLLDVNASYAAITFWGDRELAGGKPVRIESSDTKRGVTRTDLTAFLTRHLPAMATLSRGEIYVGIPGRRTDVTDEASHPLAAAMRTNSEPVGRCMVSGVNVYDSQTEAKVGGVVIECDLERILHDHLQTASPRIRDVVLTDAEGHPMMHFVRGRGLRPLDATRPIVPGSLVLKRLFAEADIHEVALISPHMCAAKVALDPYRTERCMGLVVVFDP